MIDVAKDEVRGNEDAEKPCKVEEKNRDSAQMRESIYVVFLIIKRFL